MRLKFTLLPLALLMLAGCTSSGFVQGVSPITANRPFALDLIHVKTSSTSGGLAAEAQMLNDAIVSGLREAHLFQAVSGNRAELGSGSGITVSAEITAIEKISKSRRLWAGALAGRARIRIRVLVADLNSGRPMETFEAGGESSGGSALAGTTDEAIDRAADEVVREVLNLNAQTAQ
jgi:hypothetical protein